MNARLVVLLRKLSAIGTTVGHATIEALESGWQRLEARESPSLEATDLFLFLFLRFFRLFALTKDCGHGLRLMTSGFHNILESKIKISLSFKNRKMHTS